MASGGMKCVIFSTVDSENAITDVSSQGGVVGLELSAGRIYAAAVPDAYEENVEGDDLQEWLDETSDIIVAACNTMKGRAVTTIERPVPFTKKGYTAVALLLVSGEADDHKLTASELSSDIIPGLYLGANSLALSYPDDNIKLHFVLHDINISPSSQVPYVGMTSWPSPVPFQDKLYCFYQGNSIKQKRLMYTVYDPSTGAWGTVSEVPDTTITDGPSAAVFNDKLYVFHSGSASRHEVWYNVFDGSSWAGDARVPNTRITGGPSVLVLNGKLYCFHQGYTLNDNELWYNVYDGSEWAGDKLVTDTLISESPSAVVFDNKIYCFYQGVNETANTLLVNRLDPETETWSGHVSVPYTSSITKGPSALVFDEKIYVFHQNGDEGELWFNTTSDGSLWRGDTPLTHERSTGGLGTTVFNDELYCFFQGAGKNSQALMYRPFAAGSLEWEDLWSAPALASLGYTSYTELAEAVKSESNADYGYVVCVTKLPLLYNSYANETRLCFQYPSSEDIGTSFAKIFDATGAYDRSTDPSLDPRYTFALTTAVDNTVPVPLYSTGFLFHQGASTKTQLWFSLLDRRTGTWTEMQGPTTGSTTGGQAAVLYSDTKLYVFYLVDGQIYYNILDGVTWKGEAKMPDIAGASGTPGAVLYDVGKIHCFYQGSDNSGELWYNVLNVESGTWEGEHQLTLQADEYDGDTLTYHTRMTPSYGPSPALFLNEVHSLYNGGVLTSADNGQIRYSRLRVNRFTGQGAITDMQVPNTYLTAEPSAVVYNDTLYAFHQGNNSDGTVWYNTSSAPGTWKGDQKYSLANDLLISDGPSAMTLEGKIYCFLRGKGSALADKVWYNTLDGDNGWGEQKILPTGSGIGAQHNALAIGSLCIAYDTTPPTVERKL